MKTINWDLIRDILSIGGVVMVGVVMVGVVMVGVIMVGLMIIVIKIVIIVLKQKSIRGPRGFDGDTGPEGRPGYCQCKNKEI